MVTFVFYSLWDIFIVGEASDIFSLKGRETKPGLCLLCVLNNTLVAPVLSLAGDKFITERWRAPGHSLYCLVSGAPKESFFEDRDSSIYTGGLLLCLQWVLF